MNLTKRTLQKFVKKYLKLKTPGLDGFIDEFFKTFKNK